MNKHLITDWQPEQASYWQTQGHGLAVRNLWLSIPALLLAFAVWMVWSMVVINLPKVGFQYSTNQLFWLTALPGLSGALLRIFYSFMVPIFGGRIWTTLSTASLLLPALGLGMAVQDVQTSYPTMLILALLCGLGGGNFASSMANIGFFFPASQKGYALNLNAGFGNLGVAATQFIIPLAISAGIFGALGGESQSWLQESAQKKLWLQNAGFIWVPFILAATIAAWFGMHDLAGAKASFSEQAVIFKRKHNWLMCWLSIGTFGSFIGYAAGFPLLIHTVFPDANAVQYAFLGPLLATIARIAGTPLANNFGGAKIALAMFVCMICAALAIIYFLPSASSTGNFTGFFWMFMLLFAAAGVGNAATFHMIPTIFLSEHQRACAGKPAKLQAQAVVKASTEANAALGFTSAMAAIGAFFVPKSYGTAIAMNGSPEAALWAFISFYCTCVVITWLFYSRRNAPIPC